MKSPHLTRAENRTESDPLSQADILRKKFFPRVWETSSLNFGLAFSGESSKIIAPNRYETPENGSFMMFSRPFKKYDIVLAHEVYMKRQSGPPSRGGIDRFRVYAFRSYPEGSVRIGLLGFAKVYIGATREALPKKLLAGQYQGTYIMQLVSH